VGLARKGAEQTRFETAFDQAFHDRVRAGFLALADQEPDRFRVIDAQLGPDDVFQRVLAAVQQVLAAVE
jgi:dTMP kinase